PVEEDAHEGADHEDGGPTPGGLSGHARLERVLDVLDPVELDVDELAADFLDPADVDSLHDVASLWVDGDRPARALPLHALGGGHERVALGLATRLLERLVDEAHTVVASHRIDVRVAAGVRLVERLYELPIRDGVVIVVVVIHRNDADGGVAHALARLVFGQLAHAEHFRRLRVDAALGERLADRGRLHAARYEDEDGRRVHVPGALDERREIRIGHREAYRAHHLPARILEAALEALLGVMARTVVRYHRVDLLDAVLARPRAERFGQLRHGRRRAHHVRRFRRDDGRRRVHDHHELLRFRGHVGGGKGVGRQDESGQDVHLIPHDQLLSQAFGDVRGDATRVLANDLDLLAGHGIAVLLEVELDGVVHLRRRVGELAGVRHDEPDLDRRLSERRR